MSASPSKPVVVIGSGPAGYVCAIRLAQLGQDVVCVEKGELGGVCLNVGCIPSKALISASQFVHQCKSAEEMGIKVGSVRVDVERLIDWKESVVGALTKGIGGLFAKHKIRHAVGTARLEGPTTVVVGEETIEAEAVVIATGSRPVELGAFPFSDEDVWSSTGALSPKAIPDRLLVIGGGYIGLEMAGVYLNLGSEVTVVEATGSLLPGTESDLSRVVQRSLRAKGADIRLDTLATGMEKTGDGINVALESGETADTVVVDKVLSCVGRMPNTGDLGLEEAGVKLDERGFVVIDGRMATSVPGVYAIGDAAGGMLLAHKGSHEGLVAAAAISGDETAVWDKAVVPEVIFTHPEIACCGLTEAAAVEAGFTVKTGRFPFAANGRALSLRAGDGFVKIVADAADDRVLGVQMVGPEVTEMISEAALAIEMGATLHDLAHTIHPHPTLPETIMEAAEAALGQAVHIYQA